MRDPELRHVARGEDSRRTLVFIKGYLSEKDEVGDDDFAEWVNGILEAGWRGSVHHLWWNASSKGMNVVKGLGPLHWGKIRERAGRVGNQCPELFKGLSEDNITMFGFSLGARVVYHALLASAPNGRLEDAVLVGGAIRRDSSKEWGRAASVLRGRLVNVYNKDDRVLQYLYRWALGRRHSPCGRKPIEEYHPKIVNIDATEVIGSTHHPRYRRHLRETVGARLWRG